MIFPATSAIRIALVAFSLVGLALASVARAADTAVDVIMVLPSATDTAIKTFDQPHRIYLRHDFVGGITDRTSPPLRQQLLLWIPGTAAPPPPGQPKADPATGREGAEAFCQLAARLGYHVISLRYPNTVSASAERREDDPAEFERFRLALIEGGASKHMTSPRSESIEYRLIKLLQHLAVTRPAEGWRQFLHDDATLRWERFAVAGQSQGGGHAALIGLRHLVARVICTGAPKDYSLNPPGPAAWLRATSATPKSRFFAFNHLQDKQAATWPQQLENLRALKLDAFGPPVNVDTEKPPYRHTRILTTNYPGRDLTSKEAHTTVISFRNASVFEPVWRYMLTETVE